MIKKPNSDFQMKLANAEGIPVLYLCGTITKAAMGIVVSTLERLSKAGHYNVVLNIERAQFPDWSFLNALSNVVNAIKAHYGTVKLVASQDIIQHLLRIDQVARLFKVCRSERQAISQIKKLTRQPDGIFATNAQIMEK